MWLLVDGGLAGLGPEKPPHAPSLVGCANMIMSTYPSSSPELGIRSGPSLSNSAKLMPDGPVSMRASACRNPSCIRLVAATLKMPLQLVVLYGLPVHVPGVPVYVTSLLSSTTQPIIWPRMLKTP